MSNAARRRKAPLPASPASSGELAALILQQALERADYIGHTRRARSHFLLIELSNDLFLKLCHAGAEQEDDEDSDGLQHDDCDDEDNGDTEQDRGPPPEMIERARAWLCTPRRRRRKKPNEYAMADPTTERPGKWVMIPRGAQP